MSRLVPRPCPLLLAALLAVAGCDQATYVEGVVRWDSRDGTYGLEYITPPWEVERDDGDELRLRIAPELFGTSLEGSPPTHVFVIGPVDPEGAIADLLPEGIDALDGETSGGPGSTGELDTDGGDASGDYLDVDFGRPQAVALAELDALVRQHDADLVRELGRGEDRGAPWTYEVVIAPGVFVRGYYFAHGDRTIRAIFTSLFTLADGDVDQMARTITVGTTR